MAPTLNRRIEGACTLYAPPWDSRFVVAFVFDVDFDLDLDLDLAFDFAVGGGPRWARYEKSRFLYNKIPHFRLSEARLLRRAEFGSPTKNDFFHALRGVFFFSVPFLRACQALGQAKEKVRLSL